MEVLINKQRPSAAVTRQRGQAKEELADCDWLLFACKSQHTRRLAERLKPHVGPHCRLWSLQNGVDNEPMLAEIFGRPVLGGLMRKFFAHITAPGEVEVWVKFLLRSKKRPKKPLKMGRNGSNPYLWVQGGATLIDW